MSSAPCIGSPIPSRSTDGPSAAITPSTAALSRSDESTENGIASPAIQSSNVAYEGAG